MNEESNKLLTEIRALMQEQNALIREVRDMNKESTQRILDQQERNDDLIARTERIQSNTEKAFSVSNLVIYGALLVIMLLLFQVLRRPW